jgi:hypothetical protein
VLIGCVLHDELSSFNFVSRLPPAGSVRRRDHERHNRHGS